MATKFGYPSIERYLRSYGKYIIRQARKIIKKKGKKDKGVLLRSLKYKLSKKKGLYDISFKSAKHGDYIDKGVSGKGGKVLPEGSKHKGTSGRKTYIDVDGKRKRSPYKFKNKYPKLSAIKAYVKRKGLTGDGAAFLVSRSIYAKGITGISFYSQPIAWSQEKHRKELMAAFKKDVLNKIHVN